MLRTQNGEGYFVLGVIDHGSRANMVLQRLENKASIALLRALLNAIEQFGKPKTVRTDNEACFTSRLFRLGLWLLRIRHQRTDPHCPWMNGRVERFFGTLKERTQQVVFANPAAMDLGLAQFRVWYNHVRPHQHLQDRTPAEVWAGKPITHGRGEYFSAWDGVLTGFYFPS